MTELTDDHITIIIGGSLGGFFLSVISFIMRKYIKSSKCHNSFLGDLEINAEKIIKDLEQRGEIKRNNIV